MLFSKEYSHVVFLLLHMLVFPSFTLYSPTEMLVCANCIQNPGSSCVCVCMCVHEHVCCISTVFKRKPTMNKDRSEIVLIANYGWATSRSRRVQNGWRSHRGCSCLVCNSFFGVPLLSYAFLFFSCFFFFFWSCSVTNLAFRNLGPGFILRLFYVRSYNDRFRRRLLLKSHRVQRKCTSVASIYYYVDSTRIAMPVTLADPRVWNGLQPVLFCWSGTS